MPRPRRYPFSNGRKRVLVDKGSRKRLRKIAARRNGSAEIWVAAVLLILAIILLLPLAVEHAAQRYLH
jgi:hypothetical protein